jgi:type I restriction enzyme S subunit
MTEFSTDNLPYEKVGKNEPVCIADEVPFEIPDNWEWARWGSIAESIQYGFNAPAQENGKIKMVRISDIQNNKVLWERVPFCDIADTDIPTYLLRKNDILFARTGGTVGKSYLVGDVPENAIYAGYLIRTRYSNHLCPEYLKFFMESPLYWEQLKKGTTATAQPNCNGQTLSKMLIPIPPANEQYRIAEKIEALIPMLKQYDIAYQNVDNLNKTFPEELKRSILQWAVQGKLVPQDPLDEPAEVLLERIRVEKQKLIKEGKIKKDKHESIIFRRDNSHYEKHNTEDVQIDNDLPFDLPCGWAWSRLRNLTSKIGAGSTPQGGRSVYVNEGIKFIRSQNVYNDGLRLEDIVYITEETNSKKLGSIVLPQDILLNITGGSIGRCAVVPDDFDIGNVNQHVMIIRLIEPNMRYWIHAVLTSPYIQNLIMDVQVGVSREGLSASKLMDFFIPVPPIKEQKRILACVSKINEIISSAL